MAEDGVQSFWFTCTEGETAPAERAQFIHELASSPLEHAAEVGDDVPGSWHIAFRRLADALSDGQPSIVVIDELPWLAAQDRPAEGALQTVWDRYLSKKPVLLILIGSDLAVMEHLTSYGRPFHQRGVEMVLNPLTPADVAAMTALPAAEALDAYLITGGLPLVCQSWPRGASRQTFLEQSFADPGSALIVSGERIVRSEFPGATRAYDVLRAIGNGGRTFTNIASKVGGDTPLTAGSLNVALRTLLDKRVIAADEPLSLRPAPKERRYRITDPFLRFWIRFVLPAMPEVERGRGDLARRAIDNSWDSWRGRAIEPVIREALRALLPDSRFPTADLIGGWWNRINNPEVDLVALDQPNNEGQLAFVGSIKWRETAPFDRTDLVALARDASSVPGFGPATPLVAVSRSGSTSRDLATLWGPDDLLAAWTV